MSTRRTLSIASIIVTATAALLGSAIDGHACTNILVTKGASADGSTMITYACDGRFHPRLERRDAADHPADAVFEIRSWSGELRGTIPQVA
ncbi:MAG: C69 family dipeptidase, partial [Holophagae bacterium]